MRFSRLIDSATSYIETVPPPRLAAAISAAIAFLLSLVLLRNSLGEAAVASQMLVTGLGGLIAAFLASRLAAYLVRLVQLRAGWLDYSRGRQLALVIVVALASAAVVVGIMVLVS